MDDLISRKALLLKTPFAKIGTESSYSDWVEGYLDAAEDARCAVENAPSVDAVEVVRCRECKHYQYGARFTDIKFCCRLKDSNGKTVRYNWSDNDFCSYGERKEKGDGRT